MGGRGITESDGALAPASSSAAGWRPKVKRYRHLDAVRSEANLAAYARDADRVAAHAFYPLITFDKRWTAFAAKGQSGEVKSRTIKYASRRDAAIFSYYRSLLSAPYEKKLRVAGIEDSVLAYRKVADTGGRGKCNIDFALEVFSSIRDFGDCSVAALDISSFFDCLEHKKLKEHWKALLGFHELPKDHYNVFKHITRYSEVEMEAVLCELGYKGDVELEDGTVRKGFLKHYSDIDAQLCFPDSFRSRIAASGIIRSYKDRGSPAFGVPQGVPLSDLLANVYMFDFDCRVSSLIKRLGGKYARYSDDIVVVAPISCEMMALLVRRMHLLLPRLAPGLEIKAAKTEMGVFSLLQGAQQYRAVMGESGGFRYLGFRFDGRRVFLRDKTLSNLWRKTAKVCNKAAIDSVRRYHGMSEKQILARIPIGRVIEKTGRVENFLSKERRFSNWTFWTYAKRADDTFRDFGSGILKQLRNHRKMIDIQLAKAITRAIRIVNSPTWQRKRKKR